MREQQSIVIVGGGAIGLSVAYHLGKSGATNVTLLERNSFTSGTSWHAAGIVGPLRSSQNLTTLARYAIELFSTLEKETGQATGYQRTGGLWLAQSTDRHLELDRIAAMGDLNHLCNTTLTPQQTHTRLPMMQTDDLSGSLWVDEDGQINPVDLCMAYLKGARTAGVSLREQCPVTAVQCHNDKLVSVTVNNTEQLPCDILINCAGLWAAQLGKLCNVQIPVQAVEHSYLVTETVDDLPQPFPIIRDLDSGIYIKGDAGRLVFGGFEDNAKIWQPDSVPADAEYLLFDEDWDHIAPVLEAALHRIPLIQNIGIQQYLTGPESFTPDTRQVMGESAELRNYYVAAGFNSIGILSSAGVGKAMADWVLKDRAPMDLWEVDIQRFDSTDSEPSFLQSRIPESVHNQFSMHWPYKQHKTGRNRQQSVWHDLLSDNNAVMGAPTGWERPLWYSDKPAQQPIYSYGAQHWWPRAQLEATTLIETGALFELSPFTKIKIFGTDATKYLTYNCTRSMDIPVNTAVYTLMLNDYAGIELECTVTRLSEHTYLITSGAATRTRDLVFLNRTIQPGQDVQIQDITDHWAVVGVMGPQSRTCLERLFDYSFGNDTFPHSQARQLSYHKHQIHAVRISYVGELGWELYIPVAIASQLLAELLIHSQQLNMCLAGHYCLDSCRLEKNYPHWGHDIGSEDSPLDADLLFAVRKIDNDYRGAQALENRITQGEGKRRVLLKVNKDHPLLLHDEPIYRNNRIVGATTSGGPGFRTGLNLCMAMIETPANPSDAEQYEVRLGRERVPATLLTSAPYDPQRLRLQGVQP